MSSGNHDKIYSKLQQEVADFTFNEEVTAVFDNMINRSVPGYGTIIKMIGVMTKEYAVNGSNCYDLGCSLGAVATTIAQSTSNDVSIIAVDSSASMVEECQKNVSKYANIRVEHLDVCEVQIENASVVVLNFTLQFVPREKRQLLLERIYSGLRSGGILILSEKVADEDMGNQELQGYLHHAFKRFEGYSDIEIEQKKSALKNIMLTDSIKTHEERLQRVGFRHNKTWYQCFNFVSLFAQK